MSFQLPASVLNILLDKLGSDEVSRDHFSADPRSVLVSPGIEPTADASVGHDIWACMTVAHLANKEAIFAGHASLKRQLLAERATFNPISLGVRLADGKQAA